MNKLIDSFVGSCCQGKELVPYPCFRFLTSPPRCIPRLYSLLPKVSIFFRYIIDSIPTGVPGSIPHLQLLTGQNGGEEGRLVKGEKCSK